MKRLEEEQKVCMDYSRLFIETLKKSEKYDNPKSKGIGRQRG